MEDFLYHAKRASVAENSQSQPYQQLQAIRQADIKKAVEAKRAER